MESKTRSRAKESNFVVQGSILAIASIVVRIIGIAYRIPMINIIGDEHTLAAYLAGYYMYRNKAQGEGSVNVILEGKCRNKKLYDQISEEFDGNGLFNVYDSIEKYYSISKPNAKKVYFYLANIQLDEYADDEFVREKKKNLRKWLALSRNSNGRFIFIPIFALISGALSAGIPIISSNSSFAP
mgnify:CR=1 FL=1